MGFTYATYSPSLCPTISSVIATSTYDFPLCTAKRRPTKLGRMVAARFVVRIGGELAEKLRGISMLELGPELAYGDLDIPQSPNGLGGFLRIEGHIRDDIGA